MAFLRNCIFLFRKWRFLFWQDDIRIFLMQRIVRIGMLDESYFVAHAGGMFYEDCYFG